jgi:uncharacterized protein YkwD
VTTKHGRRIVVAVIALVTLATAACGQLSPQETSAGNLLNGFRGQYGLPALPHSPELDAKAHAQAERMAAAGRIFHSTNLADGVSPGWQLIGENVAMAPSVEVAQDALQKSQAHRDNMLNPAYNQMGIGVVVKDGRVYVAQVFVQR